MAISANQKELLNRAKLSALARSHVFAEVGGSEFEPVEFPGGAMVQNDTTAIALLAGEPLSAMGGALAKVGSNRALHLLVDPTEAPSENPYASEVTVDIADVARAAAGFSSTPTVWQVEGTELNQVTPGRVSVPSVEIPLDDPMVQQMRDANVEIIVEGGVVVGEVLGLEVARIAATNVSDVPRLQVGVGAYDQEAFAVINPEMAPQEALHRVADEVRHYRRPGADPHPINRLVRERWIRAILINEPAQVGLRRLAPIPSARPRNGLRDVVPALAIGTDDDGAVVLVVCSTGIDFGVAPTAAEIAARYDVDRVLFVIPERDQYPHVVRLAEAMLLPASVVNAPVPWEYQS